MDSLKHQPPTPEQRGLYTDTRPMMRVVRGAAGSGKTTVALIMLKIAIRFVKTRRARIQTELQPIRVVVFTFNRSLSSYIRRLAEEIGQDVGVEVTTLSKYCRNKFPEIKNYTIVNRISDTDFPIPSLGLDRDFLIEEVEYISGRFHPNEIKNYLTTERTGRGVTPRVDGALKERILVEIVYPYMDYKKKLKYLDWNDLASYVADNRLDSIDILVVDEAQDFTAIGLRAIVNQTNNNTFGTFVIDTAQRIYARGFTWKEVGLNIRPENSFRLNNNYRNTIQIADFSSYILQSLKIDPDGTVPNLDGCIRKGEKPIIVEGTYSEQTSYAIDYIIKNVDLKNKTVGFLGRFGGGFFDYLRSRLSKNNLDYCEITGQSEWPESDANIALSTMHSSKGLEFDFVFMLGLSSNYLNYDLDIDSESYIKTSKLVAMSITRAKSGVVIGYKNGDKPSLIESIPEDKFRFKRL